MWLRLLHCYLLPLITFHQEDLLAVSLAQNNHIQTLRVIDEGVEEISAETSKVGDVIIISNYCGYICIFL